jgi:hypothetical protein
MTEGVMGSMSQVFAVPDSVCVCPVRSPACDHA